MAAARITEDTRDRVARIAEQTGKSHQDVIDVAVRKYEMELFLDRVNESYAVLRADEEAWREELDQREEWDATLADGR